MIAFRLAAIEWLKTRRRFAFGASLLFFFGLIGLSLAGTYMFMRSNPGMGGLVLPRGWSVVIGTASGVGGLVMTVMVVLLVASEKTWRTERQNIIDGLSRTQYFLGKIMLVGMLALVLVLGTVALVTIFGLLARQINPVDAPLFDATSVRMLGGLLLRFLVVGTLALLFATVASGSGAALALAIIFTMAQPIIMAILVFRGGVGRTIAPYFPAQVFDTLTTAIAYTGGLGEVPLGMPILPLQRAVIIAIVYGIVFSAGAWWSIRTRDL